MYKNRYLSMIQLLVKLNFDEKLLKYNFIVLDYWSHTCRHGCVL